MEKYVADGDDRAEHATVSICAGDVDLNLRSLSPSDSDFESTLDNLCANLSHHIEEEQNANLHALKKALPEGGAGTLAKSFGRTKHFYSNSHPMAPDKPPYETVAGLMVAPLDKLGDLFRKFPNEEDETSKQ
jgi:hypothetical protein